MAQHPYKPHRKLRRFREKQLGISQAEMAEAVGIRPGTISAIEIGQERLGVARAFRIINVYRRQLVAAGLGFEQLIREQQ